LPVYWSLSIFFIEQQNKIASESAKARQEAEKFNELKLKDADERLAHAQNQLLETYTKFQEIGSKQVNNLKEVLAFREVVDKENREKIEEIQKLEVGERQAEEELSKHKADGEKLNEQLDRKSKLLETQSEELKIRMTQIDKARLDFEQQRRRLIPLSQGAPYDV
jgi:hypothetical protein